MKYKRHSKLLEIVNTREIETQEDLAEALEKEGFNITQATISRDIKELKLIKVLSKSGRYKYSTGINEQDSKSSTKYFNILKETVVRINVARNLIVVKTHSGMAQAAAAAIDALNFNDMIGTIAGDDTILLVSGNDETAETISEKIRKITMML